MLETYDVKAPKKATTLTINSDLLRKAKSYRVNLSKNFEIYFNNLVKARETKAWQEENAYAIEEFNQRVVYHPKSSRQLLQKPNSLNICYPMPHFC